MSRQNQLLVDQASGTALLLQPDMLLSGKVVVYGRSDLPNTRDKPLG